MPVTYVLNSALAAAAAISAGLCALGIVSTKVYYAAVLYMLYASASSFVRVFLSAKFGGVKPETVGAVTGMIEQLSRNQGVREYWEASGRHTFAVDFAREVDRIFEAPRAIDEQTPGPLPFHVPVEQ